jgi:hypothetical protein
MLPVVNYGESHFRNALVPSFNVTVTGPFILSGPSIGEVVAPSSAFYSATSFRQTDETT